MKEIIFYLLVLLCSKWIIIIASFIPVRIINNRTKKKLIANAKNDSVDVSNAFLNDSFIFKIRRHLQRYLRGYVRYFYFQIGTIPSHRIRNFIYIKVCLIEMEEKSIIYWGAELRAPYNLKIGRGSIIGDKSVLDARNKIIIGNNVNFSSNVSIYTHQHNHRDPFFNCNTNFESYVKVGDRVWIGPNVIILPGVHIGEGAVVAAGSVVTNNVEPFTIVGGIPSKKIGERNRGLLYEFEGKYIPFY